MANRAQTNSTGPNWKAHLGELLRGVLSRLRGRIIAGVELDELFRGIRRVRFERLSNEDKVCVAQDTLVADDTFLEEVYTGPGRASVQDSLAVMYVLHEAVHLHQGIGKKAAVRRLRSTGDEQTLMHVDLAADHFAAVATSKALPGRSLPELQAIQIEALRRFPAVAGHSRASVRRKSRRLTSLMGDQMLRLAEGVPPPGRVCLPVVLAGRRQYPRLPVRLPRAGHRGRGQAHAARGPNAVGGFDRSGPQQARRDSVHSCKGPA